MNFVSDLRYSDRQAAVDTLSLVNGSGALVGTVALQQLLNVLSLAHPVRIGLLLDGLQSNLAA
jgi:hypothetical protein